MATNYNINYDDERFQTVEAEKQAALDNVNNTYNNMINQSDKYYQDQINAAKDYANTQSQVQQDNTDLAIEQINQQKDQTQKDYTKEQKASYVDWQKQSNQYGANAETMASQGLNNTGYSESSQVSMYNQYQGRIATARESFNTAVLNYNNSIKEAQLANNSALAEIAYNALQTQLQLSLEGFQYKNTLLQTQLEQQQATDDRYYTRWQDTLNQMNTENQFNESIRQYEQNYDLQVKQFEEEKSQYQQNYALQVKQYEEDIRQFDKQIDYYKQKDAQEYALEIKKLEEEKRQAEIQRQQWEKEYALKQAQLEEQKREADMDYRASISASSSGSGSISSGSSYAVNTAYYQGNLNSDANKYGTFSNGYQPKGISGHGELSKSGQSITINTQTLSGQTQKVVQNIWKAKDGSLWYWEGRKNAYVRYK